MNKTNYQSNILKPPLAPVAINTRIDIRSIATLYDVLTTQMLPIKSVSELVRVAFEDTLNYRAGKHLYTVDTSIKYLQRTGIWTKTMTRIPYAEYTRIERETNKQKQIIELEQELKGA